MPESGAPEERATSGRSPAPDAAIERRGGLPTWLAAVLLGALSITFVSLHTLAYTKVSPIDELQHIDYLYRSPDLVAPGDRVGEDAMREEACRGIDYPDFPLPPCSETADYDPADFQENGYNTASINTPVYYTITHGIANVISAVTPSDNLVTSGRLAGAIWLGAGLMITYAAGRRLGARPAPLIAVLVLAAAAPSTVYPSAIISPDAAVFTVGAAAVWTLLWWEERPARRWPAIGALAVIALMIKMTNIFVLLALGIYILLRLFQPQIGRRTFGPSSDSIRATEAQPRSWVTGGVTLLTATLLAVVGWSIVQRATQHGDPVDVPMNVLFSVDRLTIDSLIIHVGEFLDPLSGQWAAVGNPALAAVSQRVASVFIASGLMAAGIFGSAGERHRTLAQAWIGVGVVGASLFVLASYLTSSVYVPPPSRYAYSLVPGMVAVTAVCLRTRPAVAVSAIAAALAAVATVVRLT